MQADILCSVVIGAGAAGIMMAAKIPRYFKDGQVELQVYEKNHEGKFEHCKVTHCHTEALSVHQSAVLGSKIAILAALAMCLRIFTRKSVGSPWTPSMALMH